MMRTRFAPSPTGLMHFGNCRTALFSYLLAKHHNGEFVLRIEDTDKERSDDKYSVALCRDLKELGIEWDSGPDGDSSIPNEYHQSQRSDIYDEYYNQLLSQGLAYRCFCSENELKLTRKRQLAAGEAPRYSGTCRSLSKDEHDKRIDAGEKPALRLKVSYDDEIEFEDMVRGQQKFYGKHLGDFVIRKSDGGPSFMFANALDDALMDISVVLRGEDHLSNTPRQILVLKAVGLADKIPQYAHISLIVGADGAPLSKRNGSRSIREMLDEGYLPLALLNYMARLGCKYEEDKLLGINALYRLFSKDRLARAAAKYDIHQLNHWQKNALPLLDNEGIFKWLDSFLQKNTPEDKELMRLIGKYPEVLSSNFIELIRYDITLPKDVTPWVHMIYEKPIWDEKAIDEMKDAGKDFFTFASRSISTAKPRFQSATASKNISVDNKIDDKINWCDMVNALSVTSGREKGKLFMPLRLALTGKNKGFALDEVYHLLGKEESCRRLDKAAELCG